MESPRILSQRDALLAQEFGVRTAIYAISGLLGTLTRVVTPLSVTSLTLASASNSAAVTYGKEWAESDSTTVKALSLGLSTLALALVGAPLLGRLGFAISSGSVICLAFFNALGELVRFTIPLMWKNQKPEMPQTKDALDDLSDEEFAFICGHFQDYEVKPELQQDFETRAVRQNLLTQSHPTSKEAVAELSFFQIKWLHENYTQLFTDPEKPIDPDILKALHHRFYTEDLPFPEGKTVESIETSEDDKYYDIEVTPPLTVEVAKALTNNQLAWLFASLNESSFSKLPLDLQAILWKRFAETFADTVDILPIESTAENVKNISDEAVRILHEYYSIESFTDIPEAVQVELDDQFIRVLGPDRTLQAPLVEE